MTYREALVYPSFFAGVVQISSLLLLGTSFALPPLRWFMHALWLPRPGQGPSAETMDRGFLKVPLQRAPYAAQPLSGPPVSVSAYRLPSPCCLMYTYCYPHPWSPPSGGHAPDPRPDAPWTVPHCIAWMWYRLLQVTAVARGSAGSKTRVMFYCPTDPGYRDTARMLVEVRYAYTYTRGCASPAAPPGLSLASF